MRKHSVLITGATSLIISDLIDKLLNAGYEVTGVTREVKDSMRRDIKWVEWDLTKPFTTGLVKTKYNIIVHAAALSNTYHPSEYDQVNVVATQNICRLAHQLNTKRFIYISSLLACSECGLYGESKLRAEQLISSTLKNWIIVRPSQIYGQSTKNPINQLIASLKSSNIAILPANTLKNLYPMYYKDFTQELLKLFISETIRTSYFITGPQKFSYDGLVREISNSINKKYIFIKIPKFVMLLISKVSSMLHLRFGPYPDQIHRLYYAKPSPFKGNCIKTRKTIGEYCR